MTRCAEKPRRAPRGLSRYGPHPDEPVPAEAQYANSTILEMVYPSDNTQELLRHAAEALQRIYRKGYEYQKAGAMVSGVAPAEQTTVRLFDETLERFRRMMSDVDMLNRKYGRDTVRLAGTNP